MQIRNWIVVIILAILFSSQARAASCSCASQIPEAEANTTDGCSKTYVDGKCTLNEVGLNKTQTNLAKNEWISRISNELNRQGGSIDFSTEYPKSTAHFGFMGPFTVKMLNGIIIDSIPVGTSPSFVADIIYFNNKRGDSLTQGISDSITESINFDRLRVTIGNYCISYFSVNSRNEFTLNMLPGPTPCARNR